MSCLVAVGFLFISMSCFSTLCTAPPQEITSELKGPLQPPMNKMAIFNEDKCLRQGGQCVMRNQCPEGKLAEIERLCPAQKSNDVECCYTAVRSAASSSRCEAQGGICRSGTCGSTVVLLGAEDCLKSEVCCALVT